ncbi:phytanoyl-CoA dioxygenase family protein [Ilumatobacter sp.]|uniref:phytanoyl-CoA dioxygenase family protein n=1 Tax=Ilumatobacter sp. TaxID=1967498 RepID=UPI003C4EA7DF
MSPNAHSDERGDALVAALDIESWTRDGYLHVPAAFDSATIAEIRTWVDDVADRKPGELGLMQHYEHTDRGAVLARSERLLEVHDGWRSLVAGGGLPAMAGRLLGEPAVLYKEKINYKFAGGAGFAPHQDAPAYAFVDTHLTGMLAIDDADLANGCLEVVPGMHDELLPLDDDGCIRPDVAAELHFRPVPVRSGDLLWFHSRVPHRSGPNDSETTRRALFCTYNAFRLGDLRAEYYDDKARFFEARGDDPARLSTIGDFQGSAPTEDELRAIGVLP